MDDDYEPQEAIITEEWKESIEKWIDAYASEEMTDEDKVKHISKTENDLLLIRVFRYISLNKCKNEANQNNFLTYIFKYIPWNEYKSKVNEIFSNIEEELLKDILDALHPSLHMYFYSCLDKYNAEYVLKRYNNPSLGNLIEWVMNLSILKDIEDKKMLWRFAKDFADNSKHKELIIDGLVHIAEGNIKPDVLDVIVNGVKTESGYLPECVGLITGEFLKSMVEKEDASNKKHEIIGKLVKLLGYSRSDNAVKDVLSAITDMEGLEKALDKIENPVQLARVLNGITDKELLTRKTKELVLLIEKGGNALLADVLNVISNKDIARTLVQECAVHMNDSASLAQTANKVKDKEIVYYMMELINQKGMLMNKKILSCLEYDTASVVIYGVCSASGKPGLLGNKDAAEMLGYFAGYRVAEMLSCASELAAAILECMEKQDKDAIDNMIKDIRLAEELNKIGADDIEELRMAFDSMNRRMTLMLFKHLNDEVMKTIMRVMMNSNEKMSLLIELSDSMAVFTAKPSTEAYLHHEQEKINKDTREIIDKIWRVYGDNSVYDLLLGMSNYERKRVLKQLGHRHEIDALIYVGTEKNYEKYSRMKDDIIRIFSAIENERRNGLLNDLIHENGFNRYRFNTLMIALKGPVECNEIAYMLLGVKDKSRVADMIDQISIWHGNEYLADILLSIDDNRLRSMISGIKDDPVLIVRIFSGANDIDKLNRLFNIIKPSAASEEDMKTVLAEPMINNKIVNELIDKSKYEQNKILRRIDDAQLVGKIKCAIKEAQLSWTIRKEPLRYILDICGYILYNMPKILDSSNREELEKIEANIKELMHMLKMLDYLSRNHNPHDVQTNKLDRVVEKWNFRSIIQAIIRSIPGLKEPMSEMIGTFKIYGQASTKFLYVCLNNINRMNMKDRMIENNIYKYLIKTMLDIFNLIADEIDKIMEMVYNEYINGSGGENKSISDQSKSVDEMLNEMTPVQLRRIVCIVVQNIYKQLFNINYQLSFDEAIEALPYFGGIINNSESNGLNNGAQKKISVMILTLFMLASICKGMINQNMEYNRKLMPAIVEFS
ncbi:hypothetical protein HK407_12g16680 [Ordospora pajunii]|uniref:uncharacterized protein n=1 Tax=Ordospora pajunii TaxID=3039483 RepID=UPI0029528041|nr:uncharacterized protein HK407_12g16680 [Ordospora pajunii]KAH9410539.1 hypothetical protein HK407_12g16680 [Ordospora pajunii]